MARSNDRDRNPKRAPKEARPRGKRKVCVFCKERTEWVDYKDVNLLRRFMSERGKIRSRRVTGNCTQHRARCPGSHKDGSGSGAPAIRATDRQRTRPRQAAARAWTRGRC